MFPKHYPLISSSTNQRTVHVLIMHSVTLSLTLSLKTLPCLVLSFYFNTGKYLHSSSGGKAGVWLPAAFLYCCGACPWSRPSSLHPVSFFACSISDFTCSVSCHVTPFNIPFGGWGRSASHCDWAVGFWLPCLQFDKLVVFKNLKCRMPSSVCLYFWNICTTYN